MVKSAQRHEVAAAMVLAAVAGFVDAIGFVVAGGFFASFMTGNTTRAAVGLAGSMYGQVATAASLIVVFVVGVVVASVIGERAPAAERRSVLLIVVGFVLGISALLTTVFGTAGIGTTGWPLHAGLIAAALAMGALNTVFERDGEVAIGVTYMTGTLVKLGQQLAAAALGRPAPLWRRYLALWGSLALGGALGALGHRWLGTPVLWVAVAAVLLTAAALHPSTARTVRRRSG